MKKLFLLLVVFTLAGMVNAQEKKSNEVSTQKLEKKNNFDEWSNEMNLTEAQKAQIMEINESAKTKKQAIRSTGTASDFKKINDDKEAAIEAILTPEQKAKKQQIREQKIAEKNKKAEMKVSK